MSVFSAALSFCPDTPASNATPFTTSRNAIAVKSVILCKAALIREAFESVKGSWFHFSRFSFAFEKISNRKREFVYSLLKSISRS
jgi:hypothetical protein